jgi:hypothetical protein
MVFARAETIKPWAGLPMPCSSQRGLCLRPGRPDFCLRALPHPRGSHLRQAVQSAFVRTHHACMGLHVVGRQPQAGSPLDPLRVIILGYPFGAFPDPASLMEPAPSGFRRDLDAVCGLERGGEGRPTPPGAAPAVDPWGFCEYGAQSAREPGHEEGRLHRAGALPRLVNPDAEAPGAIRTDKAVHTGA